MKFAVFTTLTLAAFVGSGFGAEPTVQCPVPVSPVNGQIFLMKNGDVVKYVCNSGFKLLGSDIAHCKDDTWSPDPPTCIEEEEALPDGGATMNQPTQAPTTTQRPLFKWDDDTSEKPETVKSDEDMQNDEARLHMMLYPHRRRLVTRLHQIPSETKSDESEQKADDKTEEKKEVPSFIYVRRGKPGHLTYTRAALHNPNEVVLVSGSKEQENGDVAQSDERWRYLHWLHQAGYPYPSTYVQSLNGHPVVMTLSESQLAWINSLYPEVRDKYLKDLYSTRAREFSEELRAQYLYGHYPDAYRYWYYNNPYYSRQPVSVVAEDPEANFDYSCHQVDDSGRASLIRAPLLPNAHVYRYDRRQNPRYPNNHYLTVEYRCNPGYVLLDTRVNEMFCSKKGWVGTYPVCVPRT